MRVADFDYDLPSRLIAQRPLPERDQSRMMVLDRRTGRMIHARFREFPEYLDSGDVLVLNTSRVIPSKAWGKKGGQDIEFLFLKEQTPGTWEVLCRPARKVRIKDVIAFSPRLEGQVKESGSEGKKILEFSSSDVLGELEKIGFAPLPPYIKRTKSDAALRGLDLERYQTVFAASGRSIAAPTAGLHLTQNILKVIRHKGVMVMPIALDVGLATFQPVRVETIEDHRMLEETYSISSESAAVINAARQGGRAITAVGTTSVRALEAAFSEGAVRAGKRSTNLFISPGFRFSIVDRLLTNFHLPRSTLLMLVASFAGLDFIKKAYAEAIRKKYRFYSYGDCMLIL